MKKALVILKDKTIMECEYKGERPDDIYWALVNMPFVCFYKKTFACDTIEMIEWID